MPYLKKTCVLPYRIEVEKVHSSRYGSRGMKYAPKKKATAEEMQLVNERNRIKKLYRKIAANFDFGDYHMQLTYRPSDRPSAEAARECLKDFLKQMRREFKKRGQELKYIVTTEYQTTAIHHHLVINEIGETAKLAAKCWKYGKVFFSVVYENGEVMNLAAYLIKETQNSFRDPENPSKLSYSCSRNLINPKEKVEVVKADTWMEIPVPPAGYWIRKDSIVSGFSKITGYPYQYYTCVKYDADVMREDDDGWIRPRKRKRKEESYENKNESGNEEAAD